MSLKRFGEFDLFDERASHRAIHIVSKFIAVVEALAERLHLVTVTCESHDVALAVVLKIEHKLLPFIVKGYSQVMVSFFIGKNNKNAINRASFSCFFLQKIC